MNFLKPTRFNWKHHDLIRGFLEQHGRGDWNLWFDREYQTLAAAVSCASDYLPKRVIKKLEQKLREVE